MLVTGSTPYSTASLTFSVEVSDSCDAATITTSPVETLIYYDVSLGNELILADLSLWSSSDLNCPLTLSYTDVIASSTHSIFDLTGTTLKLFTTDVNLPR